MIESLGSHRLAIQNGGKIVYVETHSKVIWDYDALIK